MKFLRSWNMLARNPGGVLELQAAVAFREELRDRGKLVVFTNGCFDLLHAGHVAYLQWARERGDALFVGVNTDVSVRALKGSRRPLMAFEERAVVLAALRCVDAVVGFQEKTPEQLLGLIRPDVHVKSAQYRIEELPERIVVEAAGGKVLLAPHIAGHSTTDVIARILERFSE
jgi:D-beta-D-heptose 7-phosphate kinase/D-beta-D-heptose 1-phosphate adenosyltransferase